MAYDEDLADRLRSQLTGLGIAAVSERKMFGGLAFMIGGHMAVVASGQGGLMVRVDPEQAGQLLENSEAETVVMRGREMGGWLRVSSESVVDDDALQTWIDVALDYVQSLPPKS